MWLPETHLSQFQPCKKEVSPVTCGGGGEQTDGGEENQTPMGAN